MSVQGKNSLSYKKKNVEKQNQPHTGFKNITFAHEFAAAGESFIPFSSLVTPARWSESGLVNPDPASLLAAQLQAFRPNVTVTSSAKGLIQKEEYIVHSNRIEFKDFTSEINEVFEVEVSDVMITGNLIVDMRLIRVEGELAETTTDFVIGYDVDVLNEEIIVFRNGVQLFRSDNNESSGTTGNYYYLNANVNGKSSVIRFFEAATWDEPILVAGTGGIVDQPNVSTFQQIEHLAGQIDALVPTVAGLAGVPVTNFQSSPNYVDLKQFGDRVLAVESDSGKLGDVKTSMLNEAQFQTLHGISWVLMDGRDVTGTDYDSLVFAGGGGSIPDARGQFLRGANNGRVDGQENPDNNALGTQQTDKMQGHFHEIRNGANRQMTPPNGGVVGGSNATPASAPNGADYIVAKSLITDGVNGTPRTGIETAPKNVTINYFIKINS